MEFYQCLTEFIFLEDDLQKADVIFVPGGNYPDAAIHAAQLYKEGWAPYILPSGRYSIVKGYFEPEVKEDWSCACETEWEYLSKILQCHGVPKQAILREDQATYTYENAIYSRKRLIEEGIQVNRAILSCQAFHARRSLMYYQEQFPEVEFLVSPTVTKNISKENWMTTEYGIDTVLGEVERCGAQFHEIMREHLGRRRNEAST